MYSLKRLIPCLAILFSTSSFADKLTLYTSQIPVDAQMTVDSFNLMYPDIEVDWIRDGTTQLVTRLEAEIKAGVTKPDVLLIADSITMASFKQRNLLYAYKSEQAQYYDTSFYDSDFYYYGTKLITTGIAYHRQADFKPTQWQDLANPAIKGQVVMPSPLYSGAAMIHLATLTAIPQLGWNYYEALKENGATAQGGNGGVLTAVANGTKPYGVLVDYMAIRAKAKGSPIEFIFPKEGVSFVTEPVAIMANSQNLSAAQKFVDFVLSQSGQQLVLKMGYIPAMNDMPMPAGFPERNAIKLLSVDTQNILNSEQADKARFKTLFTQ